MILFQSSLERLESSDLVRRALDPELAFWFKHALVQETVLASMLKNDRKRLHWFVGEALETLFPEKRVELAPVLVQHYAEAEDDAKTFRYALMAARSSARVNANAEALQFYTRALGLGERMNLPNDQIQELYLHCGRTMELQGNYEKALENYHALEQFGKLQKDPLAELAALIARATIHGIPSRAYDAALAQRLNDRALELARELDDKPAQAKILWNLMLKNSRVGEWFFVALEQGEEALRITQENHLREQQAYVLNDLSSLLVFDGQIERGYQYNLEARAMWLELDNMPMYAGNLGYAVMNDLNTGRFLHAIEVSKEAVELSRKINNSWDEAFAETWVGQAYLEVGEIDAAEAVMLRAIKLGESAFPPTQVMTRSDLARLYIDCDQVEQGIELAQLALQAAEKTFLTIRPVAAGALAHGYIAQGKYELAHALLPDPIDFDSEAVNPMFVMNGARSQIELALAESDFERALTLGNALLKYLARTHNRLILPEALRLKGQALAGITETEQARVYFRRARDTAAEMNAKWSLWKILAYWSELEVSPGDPTRENLRREAQEIVDGFVERAPEHLKEGLRHRAAAIL